MQNRASTARSLISDDPPAATQPVTTSASPIGFGIADLGAALPDFVLGALFLATWVSPLAIRADMVNTLLLTMLLEFIIVHSAGFMGSIMIGTGEARKKLVTLLGLGGFYTLFVGGFSLAFRTAWPLVSFWGLMVNRLMSVLLRQAPTGEEQELNRKGWAVGTICYLLGCFATVLLPVPRLGLTREAVRGLDLSGEGLWIDEPHRAMAFGFLYFTAVAVSELFRHRWIPASSLPGKTGRGQER